jgi:hypothetical protein
MAKGTTPVTPDAKIADPAFASLSETDVQRIAAQIIKAFDVRNGSARSESAALPVGTRVAVRRPGWRYNNRDMDRGQVFELAGFRNDEKLVRLGYLQAVPADAALETCGTCGAQFLDAPSASAHYGQRHAPKPISRPVMEPRRSGETPQEYELREREFLARAAAQDAAEDDKADERENQRAPLYLENTTASRS